MEHIYGVIGDPIAHSMSPAIHNDAFQVENIAARYHHFHVLSENLPDAIKGLKAVGVSGYNVTVPHKTAIIPLLDEVDDLARAIGAVNTVIYKNGRYIGYNTDGEGFYRSLVERIGIELTSKKTLIIGAGGAARAIYFTLVKEGVSNVDIANRTLARAELLIADCPYPKQSSALTMSEAEQSLGEYDLIIQTTSSGMSPDTNAMPLDSKRLRHDAFVSDVIYNPLETQLLIQAKANGAEIQNGVDMLVNQAALAFQLWTGIFPDTQRMKEIVLNKLGGSTC